MRAYRHTQTSVLNLFALGIPAIACTFAFFVMPISGFWAYFTLGLGLFFLVTMYCFHSLEIEVDPDEIRMAFGPGFIKKSWPIAECKSARYIRTKTIDGWGIRLTSNGWLYSVSLPHAVRIRLESGKAISLGTDEPKELLAALEEAGVSIENDD